MNVIHYNPILCFDTPMNEVVTVSNNIEEVTCSKCSYYYFHPEARNLEKAVRAARIFSAKEDLNGTL